MKSGLKIPILLIALSLSLLISLPGFADSQARKIGHQHAQKCQKHKMLMDPILTDNGYVAGTMIGDVGSEVRIYRGIPYASPPVGELRWRPPQPAEPWNGIRECTQFSHWATQRFPTAPWTGNITEEGMSEDCLYLNVLTPAKKVNERLPVMVWLHGGGLDTSSGNASSYNREFLPQHGVVLVTVSHRLGPIGFMAHLTLSQESPEGASGNYGLMDLVAALEWVQRNIDAFGGDPNNVTIFGQSGGGQKVVWLMTSSLATGLFDRAIIEAGIGAGTGGGAAANYVFSQEEAEANGENLANLLGAASLEELRALPWQDIVTAAYGADSGWSTRYTVEGWSLLDTPFNIFAAGMQNDVPFMIGAGEAETAKHQGTQEWAPAMLTGQSNMYVYVFSHVPANWREAGLLAYHGLEVAYQFGVLDRIPYHYGIFFPPTGIPSDPGLNETDELVADAVMTIWTKFAATGRPSVRGLTYWPRFSLEEGQDYYLDIRDTFEAHSGFMEMFQ